jgi:hypothetical protein
MGWTKPQPPRRPWTVLGTRKIIREASPITEKPRDWRDLAPPALQRLDDVTFRIRSDLMSQLVNRVPQEDRIFWYGGMRRTWPGGDGGNGAWMTEAIAASWRDRSDMGTIKIGPG